MERERERWEVIACLSFGREQGGRSRGRESRISRAERKKRVISFF